MTTGADWRGRVGSVWADAWRRTDRAFAAIGHVLDDAVAALAPERGRALDIGCGAGGTALALAAVRPGLDIVGADLSADLVSVARARAPALRFETGDAAAIARDLAPLSFLVSRHGVMFFDDPAAAFATLAAAAAPAAPIVFTCFRARRDNGWARLIDDAVGGPPPSASGPGPFAFADRGAVAALLRDAGWTDIRAHAHDVPYVLGAGPAALADALVFARRIGPAAGALARADADGKAAIEARLADRFAAREKDGIVAAEAAIWLWTARKDTDR